MVFLNSKGLLFFGKLNRGAQVICLFSTSTMESELASFYLIGDALHVAWNEEGTRIGCKFGSWGFGITIQDLYEEV